VIAHWCGGRTAQGLRNVTALVLQLLASLPTSTIRVEHVSWSEETDGVIVAARWTLEGWTRAGGMLGDLPAGRPASIMGSTHFRFRNGMIVEEWTIFDEVGTLVQVYRA
jgi:predicted ester cyclase